MADEIGVSANVLLADAPEDGVGTDRQAVAGCYGGGDRHDCENQSLDFEVLGEEVYKRFTEDCHHGAVEDAEESS